MRLAQAFVEDAKIHHFNVLYPVASNIPDKVAEIVLMKDLVRLGPETDIFETRGIPGVRLEGSYFSIRKL